MQKIIACLLLISTAATLSAQDTGTDLVDASIRYHDPDGQWSKAAMILGFTDTRPGQADRQASFYLDQKSKIACITRETDGKKTSWHIINDDCSFDIDGRYELSEEEFEKYRLTRERAITLRNYYLYLWGLPMKLKDPGTIIDPQITKEDFNGQVANVVRVTYEKAVGRDTWYFYFDSTSNAMIGYRFYHDEAKNDGEYITLSGLEHIHGMKIPKSRTWYTNNDSTLLGTDNLVLTLPLHVHH